jgi:pyridinium-3,5-biscarboxylic acid mononucleotide sulfurtransferase
MPPSLPARLRPATPDEVVARLAEGGRALVALSGGVDSALVASLAREALGGAALAVTLRGAAVSATEVERAERVARSIGIEHHVVEVDPLGRDEYRANPSNRCYFCRVVETDTLRSFGRSRQVAQYLDGIHRDDLGDERPGLRAMDEAGFAHPLLEAGWRKSDVRSTARARGLPNWDEPSDACLASRVAHGIPISRELLARVERAESLVRARGFRRVRVRVAGADARIEVDPDEVARLLVEPMRTRVTESVRSVGFGRVSIDPRGYHAGPPVGGP